LVRLLRVYSVSFPRSNQSSHSMPLMSFSTLVFLAGTCVHSTHAASSSRILSEEPLIEYFEDFVDAADTVALRDLAKEIGLDAVDETHAAVNGGEEFVYLNASDVVGDDVLPDFSLPGWEAVWRFERKASEWARLPVSNPAVVTKWEPWNAERSQLNRSGSLHLDARLSPLRRRTVLSYLSGVGSVDSGFTVFPCVETDDMTSKEVSRRERLCSRARRHLQLAHDQLEKIHAEGLSIAESKQYAFLEAHPELHSLPAADARTGKRPVEWVWTAAHDAVAQQPGAAVADPLWALAEAMCRGEAPGFRVPAKAGAAVLFEVATPSRKSGLIPDHRLWHTGCSPRSGSGRRWTAQMFFDELPSKNVPKGAQPSKGQRNNDASTGDAQQQCELGGSHCSK